MAEITVTAPRCTVCGKASKLQVDEDAYKAWQKNTYIQDAFPTWSN